MRPRRMTSWNAIGCSSAASPIITAQPPGRRRLSASRRVSGVPAASNTRSASPGTSGPAKTSEAPRACAAARRPSCGSTTPIHSASIACSVTSPIVPAPITTARSAGPPSSPARPIRAACTPLASGSASAPSRASAPSGSALRRWAGTATSSAKPPGRWTPSSCRSAASCSMPGSASGAATSGLTAARRPSHSGPTPSPRATTRPATSWPITSGGVRLACSPR